MSREHKYKAWNKEEKVMCKIQSINFDTNLIVVRFPEFNSEDFGNDYSDSMELDEFELLEYTGLKDRIVRKDGSESKKIYRCDIIKALNRNYDCEENKEKYFEFFEVTYLNGCYMFGNWNAHEFFNRFMYIEDLGSKFENPNLLKEDKLYERN
jgi:folate-dependent tRNA-U54 methylase TrmFO/GidA